MGSDPSLNEILGIVNTAGVVGILVLIVWSGRKGWWGWTSNFDREIGRVEGERDRAISERDRAETDRKELQQIVLEKVIPVLDSSNHLQVETRMVIERLAQEKAQLESRLQQ